MTDLSGLLDHCTDMYGNKLSLNAKNRIEAYCANPTADNWNYAQTIILDGPSITTLWHAIIAIDPTFPRTGRSTDLHGKILSEWTKIPTVEQIKKAIKYATD